MDKKVILSPSLLSADFKRLGEEVRDLEKAGIEWMHWDIMDGHFVPNITFGPPIIEALRKESGLFFDVHLMIEDPDKYISEFIRAGADLVCVHAEACVHLERTVSLISHLGAKTAVALNPATPLSAVEYLLPQLDMVLIMSVNPGFGGQEFIPFTRDKISRLAEMIQPLQRKPYIQIDGGVSPENIGELSTLGANVFVSGSAFFKHPPYAERLKKFMRAVRENQG